MKVLVGADPELFVSLNDEIVSGFGMVEGTKHEPFKVENGAVQVDGMALEFNIDPAHCEEEFTYNIHSVMAQLQDMVPEFKLLPLPTAHFTEEFMKKQPEEALELGCEPDFNAYSQMENPTPDKGANIRTGGGHIHVGWTEGEYPMAAHHWEDCIKIVRALDVTLGALSPLWDDDQERRKMYGSPGSFRPKEYGVEYRVLSNAWLRDEKLIRYVYRTVQSTIEKVISGTNFDRSRWLVDGAFNGDRWSINALVDRYGLEYPPCLR